MRSKKLCNKLFKFVDKQNMRLSILSMYLYNLYIYTLQCSENWLLPLNLDCVTRVWKTFWLLNVKISKPKLNWPSAPAVFCWSRLDFYLLVSHSQLGEKGE